MRMNSNIILAGQPVNAMANFAQGIQAAGMANQIGDRNRLRDVFSTQGAGILAGDQGALDALATAAPAGGEMAMGVQSHRQTMRINEENLRIARQNSRVQMMELAQQMSAQELQQVYGVLEQNMPRLNTFARQGNIAGFNAATEPYRQLVPEVQNTEEMIETLARLSGMSEGAAAAFEASGLGQGPVEPTVANVDGVLYQYDPTDPQNTLTPLTEPRARDEGLSFSYDPNGGFTLNSGLGVTPSMPGTQPPAQPGLGAGAANVTDPNQFQGAVLDVGTTPSGFVTGLDNTGSLIQSEIPGSPAAQEAAAAEEAARQRRQNTEMSGTTVIQDLNRGLQLIPEMDGLLTAPGVTGANARLAAAEIGGTIPNRIRQFTESALSNVGLDTLQRMREASPTGGALGQVPIQQQQRLEQVLGSLRLDQEIPDLVANLQRVNNIYMDIIYGSSEERARLVARGEMSPQDNARLEAAYYDLPFDEFGRPVPQPGDGTGAASLTVDDLSDEERALIGR